jgi:arginine utilization regulatory protein
MLNIGDIKVNSLDYILIVDRNFSILFNTRYDPRVSESSSDYNTSEYLNKSFFEIYPDIDRNSSSIVECMRTSRVVIRKFQKYIDYKGKIFYTHNITIPIMHNGHILGVVELVKDITTIDNVDKKNTQAKEFDETANIIKSQLEPVTFESILTISPYMTKNIERAKFFSTIKNPTLIYGETGTGKEIFAQAMIQNSGIPRKKVVIQNCAAVPENLIESILFGTTKGAYTGAENQKGLFEEANGGILFLDELNSMPYHVQGKLLRVLQDGSFRPVGSGSEISADVKIIAAINLDPMVAIKNKVLRDDLFYRFSSSIIHLIPLRERKEDISYYMDHYIREFNKVYGKNITGISDELRKMLTNYRWNGNVRELKHMVESMVGTTEDKILDIQHLPAYMYDCIYGKEETHLQLNDPEIQLAEKASGEYGSFNLQEVLYNTEKNLIQKALQACKGNKTKAGKLLGIPRQTLKYKIDKYKIN